MLKHQNVSKYYESGCSHKKPAWKCKTQKEIEAFRGELSILGNLPKGINVKTRKGRKVKRKYKLQNENDTIMAKERIKQKVQVKAQRIRKFEKRTKFYKQNKIFKTDTKKHYGSTGRWEKNPSKSKSLLL